MLFCADVWLPQHIFWHRNHVSGLGISVLKDILWEELNKESNKIEDIVHRPKDVTRLQQELKDMGEDEDVVYEMCIRDSVPSDRLMQ